MCFMPYCYGSWFCDRRTIVALESSCAAWTPNTPFGGFWLVRQAHGPLDKCSAITLSRNFACNLVGASVLGFRGLWHLRSSMLTPTLRFKAQTCTNKGLPPLRKLNFPLRGGFDSDPTMTPRSIYCHLLHTMMGIIVGPF